MKQLFKQQALKDLMQYNRWLLIITAVLAVTSALLTLKVVNQQERWVMIPMNDTSKRMVVSSKGYSEIYLREWAFDVMQTLMTTSHDTIEAQVESVKLIARDSTALNQFFKQHISFVKGSNIHSVFFPKKVTFPVSEVCVSGLFRYWLGSSAESISQEKTYCLTYVRGPKEVLLLKDVKEQIEP